jgi:hypothetical protein
MAVSGISDFNLDLTEIIEEAFERCGSESRTGYDIKTARRSLNLLFADWANRGVNMWTFEEGQIPLIQGVTTYALPNDTVDLLEHVIRTNANVQNTQADLTITRISVSTYATLPNKLQQARPVQVWIQRLDSASYVVASTVTTAVTASASTIFLSDVTVLPAAGFIRLGNEVISYGSVAQTSPSSPAGLLINCGRGQQDTFAASHAVGAVVTKIQPPSVTVWPTPDQGTAAQPYYTFVYWRLRRINNAGDGVNTFDVPFRFLPCLVSGLAYYMALKIPGADARLPILKQQYDEAWNNAANEDQDKAAVRFVPRRMFIT